MTKGTVFQHRHYKAIASLFAQLENGRQSEREAGVVLVGKFADLFEDDNSRFDRVRFMAACVGKPVNGRDKVQS